MKESQPIPIAMAAIGRGSTIEESKQYHRWSVYTREMGFDIKQEFA